MATEQGPVLIMLPVPKPQGVVVGDDGAGCAISDGLSLPGQAGREESSAVADRAEVSDGESLSPTLDLQIPSSEPEPWLSLTWWTGHTVTAIRSGQGVHREGTTELVEKQPWYVPGRVALGR